jgi:uncharacterized protein YcbK (DUF882 family)
MDTKSEPLASPRRRFLAGLALPVAAGLVGFAPWRALAAVPERALTLQSRELGESVQAVYFADGRYVRPALTDIRRLFRDKHDETQTDIDPDLLDALWVIQRKLAPRVPLEVVCGYRSPETNAMLRRMSRGVASNSFHMYGQAVDLRIDKCPVSVLHRFALNLEAGGVGYYPRSNFVHIDTGPVRHWNQGRGWA